MSPLIKVVEKVIGVAVDIVEDVIGVVADAVDWVVDEIIEPVVSTVGDIIDAALDDPIKTIAKIAAVATGNAWALPLIDGAAVVANGGDIGDALKAAAISYVAGEASAYAGDAVGTFVGDATSSELANTIISGAVRGGASAAATAAVYGQDPWEAFLQGGLSGGVSSGVNAAMGKIDAATGGKPATDTVAAVKGSFSKLPSAAQNIIKTALTATLSGQDVTEEMLASAVMRSQVVTESLNDFFEKNPNLDDAQVAALTLAVQRSATAAVTGNSVGDAISKTLAEYGQDAFNEFADKKVKNSIDKLRGTWQEMDAAADDLNTAGELRDAAGVEYDRIAGNITTKQDAMTTADEKYRAAADAFNADKTDANWTLLNAAIEDKNEATTAFNTAYEEYDKLAGLNETYTTNNNLVTEYSEKISSIQETLVSDTDQLDEELKPLYTAVDKAFVDSMTPNFDVDEYKAIHGLADDVDGYQHWLTKGQYEGLATNNKDFGTGFRKDSSDFVIAALQDAGLDVAGLTEAQLKDVKTYMTATYGSDGASISKMKTDGLATVGAELSKVTLGSFSDYVVTKILADTNEELGTNYSSLRDVPAADLKRAGFAEKINTAIKDNAIGASTKYGKGEGVSDEDILSGKAVLQQNDAGLMEWENVDFVNIGKWDSRYGQIVWENETVDGSGNYQKIIRDRAGNILFHRTGFPALNEDGSQRYITAEEIKQGGGDPANIGQPLYTFDLVADSLDPNFRRQNPTLGLPGEQDGPMVVTITSGTAGFLSATGVDIDSLRETNPSAFMTAVGNAVESGVDFAKAEVSEAVKNSAALYDALAEYTGGATVDEIIASDTFKDTASVVVGGTGELLKAFNDVLILANINPASTPLGKLARDMVDLGGDLQSDSYKDAVKRIETRFAQDRSELPVNEDGDAVAQFEADTWYGKAGNQLLNVWDGFSEAPGYFVTEFIAKELVQEVPVIAATFLTGGAAKVGMVAAKAAAKQMTQEVIDKAAKRAGMAAGSLLDLAESAGGSAGGAFDEIYNEAINAGLSEAEAERRAQEGAVMAGVTGFITTGVSMGFLGGNEFESMVTNRLVKKQVKDAGTSIINKVANGAKITVKEGIQEAFEEGVVSGVTATHILEFNPDYDVASNIALNATLGAIGGAGTVTGVVGGGAAATALYKLNSTVYNAVKNAPKTAAGAATVVALLGSAGVTDASTVNDLANVIYNEGYTTDAEATNAFKTNNPDFVPSAAELAEFTGNKPDSDLATTVAAYVDPRFLDVEEVKAAALAEGITLTDEQAAEYAGQKDETAAVADIAAEYDPQATTREEAEQFFADQGYTPTEEEITARVGAVSEADQKTAIEEYVNPRQFTEAEVRQAFADQGYEPTDEEVADRVGQGGDTFETDTKAGVEPYVDPRQVTDAEARKFFTDLGYAPTDAQVAARVGQVAEADTKEAIDTYVDPRQFTEAEVRQFFADRGYEPTDAEVAARVGQSSNGIYERVGRGMLAAHVNPRQTTEAEVRQAFADQGYEPTDEEVAARVGQGGDTFETDTKAGVEPYVNPRQTTEAEARKFFTDLGYEPTDEEVANYVGQGNENFETNKKDATALYVDPRMVSDAEARKFFSDLGYTPTDAEVTDFVAQVAESEQVTAISEYVDPRFVTQAEVQTIADQEGLTLTETLAATYLGQKDQESTLAAATTAFDPLATTTVEAKQFFANQGFTPTDQQVADFVASKTEEEQKAAISTFVDPRQVTTDEAKVLFDALGYTSTDAEIQQFVGQGSADFATTTESGVGAYVDPRQVTDAEARKFFADLGYNDPTDEQVAQFVAQVEETAQQDVIAKYVDPRQVTRDELQVIADEEGLTLTDALAAAYVGQGEAENFQTDTLDTARTEYDPLATTLDEATQFFADTNYTATPEEIAEFVASKTEEVQTSAIGAYVDPRQMTSDEAREFLSEIGYNPTDQEVADFTGQLNDDSYQTTQKTAIDEYVDPRFFDAGEVRAAYEELGLVDVTQEDVDRFVGQYDPETGTDAEGFESTRLDELRTYMPTATFNVIKSIMGSPAVEDDPNTDVDESKDATGIYAEFEAGATRDEALEAAIAKVATDLGTTKEDLLDELGLTEDRLRGEIDAVIDDVGEVKEDVGEVKEDVEGLTEAIGEAGVADDPDTEEDETQDPTGLYATIAAYEKAGLSRDEALQKAIEDVSGALGTTKTDLLTAIGETETTLIEKIGGVETALTEEIADTEGRLTTLIEANEAAGMTRDEALQTALGTLSTELGITKEALLEEIGDTEGRLTEEIASTKTQLITLIEANEAAGMTRDEALQTAIGTLSTDLGITEEALRGEIAASNFDLTGKIADVEANLGTDIQAVADLVGKPARDVTQTDIDFVIDLIAQENVSAELMMQYDVTGDGIVDINDQTMLETSLQGGDVTLADTSMFNPATGLYLQQEQDTQSTQDLVTELNTQLNTQINTQSEALAKQAQDTEFRRMRDAGMFEGAKLSASAPDVMDIDYLYDFESIFATPEQKGLFGSPYETRRTQPANQRRGPMPSASGFAQGGQVEDENDMLLRILGDM